MARKYMSNPRAAVKILAVIRKWFSGKTIDRVSFNEVKIRRDLLGCGDSWRDEDLLFAVEMLNGELKVDNDKPNV